MEELKFDKETAEALYRIFCGLSSNCYENAEVYEEAKPNMKKAYEKVLDWGRKNCDDTRGETLKLEDGFAEFGLNKSIFDKISSLDEPKEPEQEILEETAKRLHPEEWDWREREIFIKGAKWQQERSYSEEEVLDLLNNLRLDSYNHGMGKVEFLEWFKQFKKK
jgi:hypothetical protein